MSYQARDGENANSALIVTVTPQDFPENGPLGGIEFQRRLERKAWEAGNGSVPVQTFGDYKANRTTEAFGEIRPNIRGSYAMANVRSILLALVLVFLTGKYKKIHPIAFLAASAVVGVVFGFAG